MGCHGRGKEKCWGSSTAENPDSFRAFNLSSVCLWAVIQRPALIISEEEKKIKTERLRCGGNGVSG